MAKKILNREPDFEYQGELVIYCYKNSIANVAMRDIEYTVSCVKYKDCDAWRCKLYCYLNGKRISCTRINYDEAPILLSAHDIINSHIMSEMMGED